MIRNQFITHVLSNLTTGGAELNAIRLIQALEQRGYEQQLVCLSDEVDPELTAMLPVPWYAPSKSLKFPASIQFLQRHLDSRGAHVIHGRGFMVWRECAVGKMLSAQPHRLIQSFHGPKTFEDSPLRRQAYASFLSYATDQFVCVSQDLAGRLSSWPIGTTPIAIIPNGIETDTYQPTSNKCAAKSALGIEPNETVVTCVGSLFKVKNQSLLLRSFAQLSRDVPTSRLVLVGDGDQRESLAALANELNISTRVRFEGYQANTLPYLHATDVFVQPSTYEGSPTAVMEAMSCGLIPIAAESTGCRELYEQTGLPRLVRPGDVDALTEHMRCLIDVSHQTESLAEYARSVIRRSFSSECMVRRYINVYIDQLNDSDAIRPRESSGVLT